MWETAPSHMFRNVRHLTTLNQHSIDINCLRIKNNFVLHLTMFTTCRDISIHVYHTRSECNIQGSRFESHIVHKLIEPPP